ncbi:IS3 family transposase [Haploplasma modicum]|uniref:IS3 family transposase n=1 Tax=Haploplasma modicum TaxID=2150 RepID=UPI00214C8C79|nr:IS3 family transposase [Haploplasma modicum]MCR1809495.1 IS3 family transposase [Haploplasma modicum]
MIFNYEQKNIAINLLVKLDFQYTKTIIRLGYPSIKTLKKWYLYYLEKGYFVNKKTTRVRFSKETKSKVLEYYYEIGENISKTVRYFGFPSRATLSKWILEYDKNKPSHCLANKPVVKYNNILVKEITKDIILNDVPVYIASSSLNISATTLYNWRNKLLTNAGAIMNKIKGENNINENILEEKINTLQKKYNDLQLEYDILIKAQEILKKEKGVSISNLTNKEKADIAYALKDNYQLNVLLKVLHCAKSTYFYHYNNRDKKDPYEQLRKELHNVFNSNYQAFGYRRLYDYFKKTSLKVSEKIIRRLMKEENIIVVNHKKKKYMSYLGEISPAVDNLLKRNFKSDRPNKKWLTDITEFHIPAGKVYLSPIIDCYEGYVVSWTTSTTPNANLANKMLLNGIKKLNNNEKPIIHNDRGCHYRWPEWINITKNNGLIRSMSKKGCSPDNSACEGFFGRIKNEFFYGRDWTNVSINNFIILLNKYLTWYNNSRGKRSLNGLTPNEYRSLYYK